MKTFNLKSRPVKPVAVLRRICLLAVIWGFAAGAALPLAAQVRVFSQHFPPGFMPPGAKFDYTFTTPGAYHYTCVPHEKDGMKGEIDVTK